MQKSQTSFPKPKFVKCFWGRLTLFSVISMVLFGCYWELMLYPLRVGSLLWLKILPLIPLIPGLFQGRIRSLQWLTLLIWLYITEAIVRIFSDPIENLIWSCFWLGLGVLTLITAMIAVRKIRSERIYKQKTLR